MDVSSPALGYVVPGICLALVGCYALFDLTHARPGVDAPTEGDEERSAR